jgi:uncharacterized GH25 family protein
MATLKIEGRSDDTIGAYGLPYSAYSMASGGEAMDDRDTAANNTPPKTFDIITPDEGRCRVTCIYNGCWSFAVGLVDEDDETPYFLCSAKFKRNDYSVNVELAVPDGTRVVWND